MKKPIVIIICVAAGLLLIAGVLVAVFSVRENRKFRVDFFRIESYNTQCAAVLELADRHV